MVIKRLFFFINLLLIALAVYMGVKCAYAYFQSRLDTLPPTAIVAGTSTLSEKTEVPSFASFHSIAQRNLFRTVSDTEKPSPSINLEALKDTQLELKLWATLASDNPEKAYAVIEDLTTRKQNLYEVDDTVQNAVLKMILADKVVLSVSGKDEILTLQQRKASTAVTSSSLSRRVASVSSRASDASRTAITRRMYLSRSQVDGAMENLPELMEQIRIQPYSENGVEGLSLSNIKPNSIFRRMGLRNGDILVAVDGQSLTSVDQALKLYEDLKSSDTANVEINRRSRPIKFQYQIR